MKAITILQPWAELIASGRKRIENRSWPTRFRGQLAIHAGKSKSRLGDYSPTPDHLDFGCVIAVCNLIGCLPLAAAQQSEFTEGPFCWVLDNIQRLAVPIPYRGLQGLWHFPDDLLQSTNA